MPRKRNRPSFEAMTRRISRRRTESDSPKERAHAKFVRARRKRLGITERSPAWNAETMGNMVGGAGPRTRKGVTPGPAMTQDRTNTNYKPNYSRWPAQASSRQISPNRRRNRFS